MPSSKQWWTVVLWVLLSHDHWPPGSGKLRSVKGCKAAQALVSFWMTNTAKISCPVHPVGSWLSCWRVDNVPRVQPGDSNHIDQTSATALPSTPPPLLASGDPSHLAKWVNHTLHNLHRLHRLPCQGKAAKPMPKDGREAAIGLGKIWQSG